MRLQSIKPKKEASRLCCTGNPSGFAEIVCDDFPVLHESDTLVGVRNRLRRGPVQFNLRAHLLQASNKRFNLLLRNVTEQAVLYQLREAYRGTGRLVTDHLSLITWE